jgi:hypothetical protein
VATLLEIFQQVPLTMLLGTFLKKQNGEISPQKIQLGKGKLLFFEKCVSTR